MPSDFGVWKPPSGERSISSITDFSPQALSELRAHLEASDPLRVRAANIIGIKNYAERLETKGSGSTITNTAAETSFYSYDVPADMLQTLGAIFAVLDGQFFNNTAGAQNLTVRIKYGATTLWEDTISVAQSVVARRLRLEVCLHASSATGTQRVFGVITLGAAVAPTTGEGGFTNPLAIAPLRGVANEDSKTKLKFDITVQLGAASTSLTIARGFAYTLRIAH